MTDCGKYEETRQTINRLQEYLNKSPQHETMAFDIDLQHCLTVLKELLAKELNNDHH